jgi:hypothetical protein
MWPSTPELRLLAWLDLRQAAKEQADLESALLSINDWWYQTPWRPYYLHWDDRVSWPGPWDLLADNQWCDLARALGIVYTIMILQRPDVTEVSIAQTDSDNLVLVNKGKYILNWNPGQLLNIGSKEIKIKNCIDSNELQHLLG